MNNRDRDRIERNRKNATRRWTCPLCGETVHVLNRANHLLDHD